VTAPGLVLLVQSPDYHLCNDGRPNFAVIRPRKIGQAIRCPHFEQKFMIEKSNHAADVWQIGFMADAVLRPHIKDRDCSHLTTVSEDPRLSPA
jgi:hypothetical protein